MLFGESQPILSRAAGIPGQPPRDTFTIGVLEGEGVGPQLTRICRNLLEILSERFGARFAIRTGGAIGLEALRAQGDVLTDDVCDFCEDIFEAGGAILAGPGGGRFVYDMRRRFNLFLKLNPLPHHRELAADAPVQWRMPPPDDIMVVRENMGGLYQGCSNLSGEEGARIAEHRFAYREEDVARIAAAAARIAAARRGHLTVVAKDSGLPEMTRLWFDAARAAAAAEGVELRTLDIDFGVYAFMSAPEQFDVLVVPNCFGDIMADLGGVLSGSRGCTYGGSYSAEGAAVYQTNHGAAYDMKDTDRANPVGQMLSLAMMLHETFGLKAEAAAIVDAIRATWREGWRTADLMAPGRRLAGTEAFSARVADHLAGAKAAVAAA